MLSVKSANARPCSANAITGKATELRPGHQGGGGFKVYALATFTGDGLARGVHTPEPGGPGIDPRLTGPDAIPPARMRGRLLTLGGNDDGADGNLLVEGEEDSVVVVGRCRHESPNQRKRSRPRQARVAQTRSKASLKRPEVATIIYPCSPCNRARARPCG